MRGWGSTVDVAGRCVWEGGTRSAPRGALEDGHGTMATAVVTALHHFHRPIRACRPLLQAAGGAGAAPSQVCGCVGEHGRRGGRGTDAEHAVEMVPCAVEMVPCMLFSTGSPVLPFHSRRTTSGFACAPTTPLSSDPPAGLLVLALGRLGFRPRHHWCSQRGERASLLDDLGQALAVSLPRAEPQASQPSFGGEAWRGGPACTACHACPSVC